MNLITKTVLLCMTLSVFFALFQLLLKGENFRKDRKNVLVKEQPGTFQATLREEKESIPHFVSRFKEKSFELWQNSDKLNMEIKF
ncbi:hypothetical protein ND861_11370 [Leptospira sp. 2 VSF19]|uniref:Uncharacterized protein n=1 Tax=Leptospira soteropolitanensis TaxID=2950025 RepID=A0AAW5VCQ2_9LEPT|nr:hypothetical protein [Leptospira soteropolitanensis]MCW7493096.1 hypothetical protein [Leptospira soteropolitanensis]MCW7500835.1 hypothetical protein [Leptospira soteropolitanensis]MCW7522946.1 hypothetical protein [Leptospira soteropolitanensis]MCW7526947.1 hypothetical protein [Leptospira soteropolitanensis]MCW7530664.1 hypothetical protein [Leptospira soteropolitanensis]